MRVQITGIRSTQGTKKDGSVFKSKTLYYTKLDHVEDVDGMVTGNEYISGNSPFYDVPVKVGKVYNLFSENVESWDYDAKKYIEKAQLCAILDENMKPVS